MKEQQSYRSVLVTYLTFSSGRQKCLGMTKVFHAKSNGRFIGERNFIEWMKAPIFLVAVSATEIMQEPHLL